MGHTQKVSEVTYPVGTAATQEPRHVFHVNQLKPYIQRFFTVNLMAIIEDVEVDNEQLPYLLQLSN